MAELGIELKGYQQQIDSALSPDFAQAREQYTKLIEKRSQIVQAVALRNRIKVMQRRLDDPTKPVKKEAPVAEEKSPEVAQYISTSVLRDFSMTVGEILRQWHFPSGTRDFGRQLRREPPDIFIVSCVTPRFPSLSYFQFRNSASNALRAPLSSSTRHPEEGSPPSWLVAPSVNSGEIWAETNSRRRMNSLSSPSIAFSPNRRVGVSAPTYVGVTRQIHAAP
jgi:hypothetical protein